MSVTTSAAWPWTSRSFGLDFRVILSSSGSCARMVLVWKVDYQRSNSGWLTPIRFPYVFAYWNTVAKSTYARTGVQDWVWVKELAFPLHRTDEGIVRADELLRKADVKFTNSQYLWLRLRGREDEEEPFANIILSSNHQWSRFVPVGKYLVHCDLWPSGSCGWCSQPLYHKPLTRLIRPQLICLSHIKSFALTQFTALTKLQLLSLTFVNLHLSIGSHSKARTFCIENCTLIRAYIDSLYQRVG